MEEKEIAYTVKDKCFGEFSVLNSANAWWIDRVKVDDLIKAYKIDCTDEEACSDAGISIDQYKYFKEKHPNFSTVKQACKQIPFLKARRTINTAIETNPQYAFEYMKRKKKKEFGDNIDLTTKHKEFPIPIMQLNVLSNNSNNEDINDDKKD